MAIPFGAGPGGLQTRHADGRDNCTGLVLRISRKREQSSTIHTIHAPESGLRTGAAFCSCGIMLLSTRTSLPQSGHVRSAVTQGILRNPGYLAIPAKQAQLTFPEWMLGRWECTSELVSFRTPMGPQYASEAAAEAATSSAGNLIPRDYSPVRRFPRKSHEDCP